MQLDLIKSVKPYTKTSDKRIAAMIDAIQRVDQEKIEGDIVECGVWKGGNIVLARKLSPFRKCWLYDTFEGMTRPTSEDGPHAEWLWTAKRDAGRPFAKSTLEETRQSLIHFGVYQEEFCRFVSGDVAETLLVPGNIPNKIALLRLDTDWYASTKIELEVLYPRLQKGGVLIVDDYGHWFGARRAVNEYFGRINFVEIDYTAIQLVKS